MQDEFQSKRSVHRPVRHASAVGVSDVVGEQWRAVLVRSILRWRFILGERVSPLEMTNKIIPAFVLGALAVFLGIIAFRVLMFSQHVGNFNMHPIAGLLIAPVVVALATCLGGLIAYALSLFLRISPSTLGAAAFGCWCMLPFVLLELAVDWHLWLTIPLTAPLVPLVLGARRRERPVRSGETKKTDEKPD